MSHNTVTPGVTPLISNKLYNVLKWVSLVFLPAFGALYFTLSSIWGLPYAEQVVGTTVCVNTFFGALLGLSTRQYNKSDARFDGSLVVDTRDPAKDVYALNIDQPLDDLGKADSITLKVDNPPR